MNPKTIFISAFLLFASALCLQAQGTYEYATVIYTVYGNGKIYLGISTGENYIETKVESKFESIGSVSDLTPFLEKVNELAKEGWEAFGTSALSEAPGNGSITYHLRKKKP